MGEGNVLEMTTAPVENKTAVQTVTTAVVAVLAWALTRYGVHLDPTTSAGVTGVVSVLVGAVLAWFTKHTPRVENTIEEALQILAANGYQPGTAGSAAAPVVAPVAAVEAPKPADEVPAEDDETEDIPAPSADVPPSDIDTNS